MARILWWGIGPEHNTGYGLGTRWFVPRIAALGHKVAIAVMGLRGRDDNPETCHPDAVERLSSGTWRVNDHGVISEYNVIGPGLTEFGLPSPGTIDQALGGQPDLIICLKDPWVLDPVPLRRYNVAVWAAVDCDPMGIPDLAFFQASGARPVAVSKFGVSKMREAGLDPLYVPFGIGPEFGIGDRAEARRALGLPADAFIAGINAANIGPRKAWGEQFSAFSQFRRRHPDSLLITHAQPDHPEGVNLRHLAWRLGLNASPDGHRPGDAVFFGSHQRMTTGQMLDWYHAIDVLLACTYGEGFGVPIAEAMACGKPVIASDSSAMSEMITPGCGYLVPTQPWWHPHYRAWWAIPNVNSIVTALGKVAGNQWYRWVPDEARRRYDIDMITREHWKPALDTLLAGR